MAYTNITTKNTWGSLARKHYINLNHYDIILLSHWFIAFVCAECVDWHRLCIFYIGLLTL